MYSIRFSKTFQRDFLHLDPFIRTRIIIALERIRLNPFEGVKKLIDAEIGIFRKRVGDYRIRFDMIGKEIHLHRVRHRKDVYR
jgi:mRNA interferase RelE/StbE